MPVSSSNRSPAAFSKLKKLLRDGSERTVDKLWTLCGQVLDAFSEPECRNDFRH